ncbi:heavy metal translocating P-type ATPase [Eubacteriales bacterium mix99]|jgi:Cd2+/Zn2+-exporting ATPase
MMGKRLWRIVAGAAVWVVAVLIPPDRQWIRLVLFLAGYGIVGWDIVAKALRNIRHGNMLDENFLMSIATIGAFLIGEYSEGVAVMVFYQIGGLFQDYAVGKSRRSIADLMDIRPDYANVRKGEELTRVDPDEVRIGDIIVVKPGERIPLDGNVLEGSSQIDTSALTGESVPREAEAGSGILSGCVNLSGVLTVEVTREYEESTVSKILDLVENASSRKSRSEQFITRFSQYYTPVVVALAVLLAVIPPFFTGWQTFSGWLYRALSFLVISCPCALVLSIPLSFFGGIGGASSQGILIKGGNYLEALAGTEIMVFDKTGTLTKGVFHVQEIHPAGVSKQELLELTAYAESYSSHPISLSLKQAYGKEIDNSRISDAEEISGHGVRATVDGKKILAGNQKLMEQEGIPCSENGMTGTVVYVAVDQTYIGCIRIADEVKEDSARTIKELKATPNIRRTVMLTGDNAQIGSGVAEELGVDEVYSELLPADKVEKLEELFAEKSPKGRLAFVGDGINDAPVLARADIGIAMGGLGSDAAIEAADVVLMTDEPSRIITAMNISKKTLKIVNQNIVFAIGIKILVLFLSAFGITTMWAAIFADVGVAVLAVLNSLRALNVRNL